LNRKEFGQLIASLRQDLSWTQAQLAENADLDNATLSNIERGAKRHLDPDILFKLANALQLTTIERREFFLGACGLEQEKMVRQPGPGTPTPVFETEGLINHLMGVMEQVLLPANLGDCYGDIVAVNTLLLEIFKVEAEALKVMVSTWGGFHNLHFVYGMLQSQQALGEGYSKSAQDAIRAFREGSLRYRARPYYQSLLKKFRDPDQYPLFERYWRRVSTLEDDKASTLNSMQIQHPQYGTLSLATTSSTTTTPYGELFLTYFLPMDHHTAASLVAMSAVSEPKALQLLSWPEKKPLK